LFVCMAAADRLASAVGIGSGEDPTVLATISGMIVALAGGDTDTWARSTVRHRVLIAGRWVMLVGLPLVAVIALPPSVRHHWYAADPAALAGALIALIAYVGLARLPRFAPPAPNPAPAVPKLWTRDERTARLGVGGQTTFVRAYTMVFDVLVFVFLTFISFAAVLVGLAAHGWLVAAIASLAGVASVRAIVRAARIAVIADADGVTVRNLIRTRRVAWIDVSRIVPPSADDYRCVRIECRNGRQIRCKAVVASVFQRARRLDHIADDLAALLGPSAASAEMPAN
jgi:PH (Pleckstrin Homology) domain-containing protein